MSSSDNSGRIIRIEDKLDKIVDRISSIDSTLAAQHVSLEDHIKRTALLEKELRPIKSHVAKMQWFFGLIGTGAVIVGIVEGVLYIIRG